MRTRVNTSRRPEAREDASDQVMIGFSVASDWLRRAGTSLLDESQSIVKENQMNVISDYFRHSV